MKIWLNAAGILALVAMGYVVFSTFPKGVERPSASAIKAALGSAVSRLEGSDGFEIDYLDKTILATASTSLSLSGRDAEQRIAGTLLSQGWVQAGTVLVRTAVYCRAPLVMKVMGPTTQSESLVKYYFEVSWGNFASYCREGR